MAARAAGRAAGVLENLPVCGNCHSFSGNGSVLGLDVDYGNDKGGYCTYQDAFIFCGQSSEGFRKIDVSDEANIREVAHTDMPVADADTDFATVLGNLVYLGNDHGSGSGLIVHDIVGDLLDQTRTVAAVE